MNLKFGVSHEFRYKLLNIKRFLKILQYGNPKSFQFAFQSIFLLYFDLC